MAVNIYINFGNYVVQNTFKQWNQGDLSNINDGPTNMVDEAGQATGFACICTVPRSGQSGTGVASVGSGGAAWVDEAGISDTFEYASTGSVVVMEFRNLDDGTTYDIAFYSSWDSASGNRRAEISVDGFSTVADTVEARGNTTEVALAAGVSPVNGTIELRFRPLSGDSFAHCNAIWLRENDAAAVETPPFTSVAVTG